MADILVIKDENDDILSAHNEIRVAMNEGRTPVLSQAQISAIAQAGKAYIIFNTTSLNFEGWYGTDVRVLDT